MRPSQFAVFEKYDLATLAFNTLTKEFLRLDIDYNTFVTQLENESLPSEVKHILQKGHFLVENDYDEYADFLLFYRNARYGPQPLVVFITPTLKCNASCEYCFQRDIRPGLPLQNGPESDKIILFVASKLQDATGLKINWFGGEPLLKSKYIEHLSKKLIKLAESLNKPYVATMVTNGMLLDDEHVQFLLRSRIYKLQISLDGPEELHNSIGRRDGTRGYREIINNIKKLPETIDVALRINVSQKNVSSIPQLLGDLAAEGLARPNIFIHFPLVYDFSIDNPNANFKNTDYVLPNELYGNAQLSLQAYAVKLGFKIQMDEILIPGQPLCHAIRSKGYSIWPDGSITKCIHEVNTPENLNISKLEDDADCTPSLKKWTMMEVFESGPCRKCFYLPMCGGSCVHGRFQGVEPPKSCPPSKWTIKKRMQWYESNASKDPIPIDTDRDKLIDNLSKLNDLIPKENLLKIKSITKST